MNLEPALYAILRNSVPGENLLRAGKRVLVASEALKKPVVAGSVCVCYFQEDPATFYNIPRANLLDSRDYLRNVSVVDFYALADAFLMFTEAPNKYISDAREYKFGSIPFRFESEGEMLYYMYEMELDPSEFFQLHASMWRYSMMNYFNSSRAWRKPPRKT